MEKQFASSIEEISGNIYYHKLRIRFSPSEDIPLNNYWIGSHLRNNLLFVAEKVKIKKGISLLSEINKIPVTESESLYQDLSGGFPKGYSITNLLSEGRLSDNGELLKNEIYTFSICLIGKMASLHTFFIEAINKMCKRGIGLNKTRLRLIDVCEIHPFHSPHLVYANGSDIINSLTLPITIKDYMKPVDDTQKAEINIRFLTPVNLIQHREKKNQDTGFQNKLNGFPSMYQLVRSTMYRISSLSALYGTSDRNIFTNEYFKSLDEWILQATNPVLISANIKRKTVTCIPQNDKENNMKLRGYIGHMSYYGSLPEMIYFLEFAQELGVGSNVVYGLGEYKVSYRKI